MTESRRPKEFETHIGNHKLDPSTLMMGYGFDPALSEGSLKPPIFLTSTFVFQTAAEGKRFFEGITNKHGSGGKAEGLVYSRFNGPNQEILEDRLKIWEDAETSLTFSSGMTAIATLLLDLCPPRRRGRPFGPALCGDRDDHQQDPDPVRRPLYRLPRRRHARGSRRGHGARQGQRAAWR